MQQEVSTPPPETRVREDHHNQFGLVRLILATLVILSHAFPLGEGLGTPDPLLKLTRTTTLGDLAVDFFFVISGYLVTQSLRRSLSVKDYLKKRFRRIYPGFAVAVPLSIALGLACAGRWQSSTDIRHLAISWATLQQPFVASAFGGNAYPVPNGAMWTIRYEALCYLLPIVLLVVRVRSRVALTFTAALVLMILSGTSPREAGGVLGTLHNSMRLSGCFFAGISLLDVTERSGPSPRLAIAAGTLCCIGIFWAPVSVASVGFCGGYAVMAICRYRGRSAMSRVGRRNDVSYGVYLYGWPLESFVIWWAPAISPWVTFFVSAPLALIAGWLSWTYVEAPFLKRRLRATTT